MTVGFGSDSILSDICTTGDMMYQRGCECQPRYFVGGNNGCRNEKIIVFPGQNRGIDRQRDCMPDVDFNPIRMRAEKLAMRRAAKNLMISIVNNDTSKILKQWNDYKEMFKKTTEYKMFQTGDEELDEQMANEKLAEKFKMLSGGVSIENMIDENCSDNFMTGIKKIFCGDCKSKEELLSEMFKKPEACGSTTIKKVGGVVGGATAGAVTFGAVGLLFGGVFAPPLAVIGAIVGGIKGLFV